MTALENTSQDHRKMESMQAQVPNRRNLASKVGRFLLHLLEMLLAMEAGMVVFHLLANQIPATSSLAAVADRETVLHDVVMDVFMMVPMLIWMILRRHGWRHSLEMGFAMLAPIAVINLFCSLGVVEYLPWLAKASGPAMYLGMLAAMLHRRSHYTLKAGHSGHAAHQRLGLSVSAVLAVPYVLIMIASLLMGGLFTTGSWRAAFLGIGWSTLAGFELGLIGAIILGFATAEVLVTVYHAFRRRVTSQSKPSARPGQYDKPLGRFWAFRLLAASLVLPALALVIMRVLASVLSPGLESRLAGTNVEDLGVENQPVILGTPINTAYREAEPSFTADGQTMYFNCNNADICVSYRIGALEGGSWAPPERLGSPISTEYGEFEPIVNGAGDRLYFNSNRPDESLMGIPFLSPFVNVSGMVNALLGGKSGVSFLSGLGLGHVWVSYQIEGVWSEPRLLEDVSGEPPVNSAFHDHCLSFSADGNEAFWTSTRPGGFGGNDIWTSRLVNGKWSVPENLGPNVNGPGDEHHSISTPDGKSLYVTTTRQDGYGGEDIYVTTRNTEGKWGPLVNLGPLVNGTGDDRCPAWTPDLKIFFFDSVRQVGFGGRDIWWVNFEDVIGFPLAAAHTDPASPASVPQAPNDVVP